jgi:hypothetical protein
VIGLIIENEYLSENAISMLLLGIGIFRIELTVLSPPHIILALHLLDK